MKNYNATKYLFFFLLLMGFTSLRADDLHYRVTGTSSIGSLDLNNYATLSVSFWMKPDNPYSYGRVFDNDNGGYDRALLINSDGEIDIFHDTWHYTNIEYVDQEWQHVVVVFSASDTKLYLNGVLEWTGAGSSVLSGSSYVNLKSEYQGLIDEFSFWDKELTLTEVQNIMNGPLVGDESNLVAYYNFDDGTFGDLTTNAFDGPSGRTFEPSFRLTDLVLSSPENVDKTSFRASWFAPNAGATPDGYLIDLDDDADFSSPMLDALDVGDVLTYDVLDLPQQTMLYIRVRAYAGAFHSNYSNVENLTTTGVAQPEVLAPSNITISAFTANWTVEGAVEKYFLDISTDPNFSTFLPGYEDLDVGKVASLQVSTLDPGSQYFYRIRAHIDGVGTSDNSTPVEAYTLVDEPTISSTLSFSENNNNYGFTVNFDGGDGAGRIVVVRASKDVDFVPMDYTLYEGVSDNFRQSTDQGNGNQIVYEGEGNSVVVSGLPNSGTYHVTAYEYNGQGVGKNYLSTGVQSGQVSVSGADLARDGSLGAVNNIPLNIMGNKELSYSFSVKSEDEDGSFTLLEPTDGGHSYFRVMVFSGEWRINDRQTNIPFVQNEWIHGTVTFSPEAINFYLSGELVWTYSGVTVPDGLENASIYTIRELEGVMDEISYWSKALTQEEIQNNLYQPLIGKEEHLIAYYNFNDGTYTDLGPAGADGAGGSFSESYAIVKPITTGIQDGNMTWDSPLSEGTDPTSYFLDLDDDPDFSSPILDNVSVGPALEYEIPSNLCLGTDHYYRVRGQHETLGLTAYSIGEFVSVGSPLPIPDMETLSLKRDQNAIESIDPPTATDKCGETITGITDAFFPYSELGESDITWTFTDDEGNVSTQDQSIYIGEFPENDACQTAQSIILNQTTTGSFLNALLRPMVLCEGGPFEPEGPIEEEEIGLPGLGEEELEEPIDFPSEQAVWYSFTGTGNQMTLTSSYSQGVFFMQVLVGSCEEELVCVSSNNFVPSVVFETGLEETYLIKVSEFFDGPIDLFDFTLSEPSTNITCEEAITVTANEEVVGNSLHPLLFGEGGIEGGGPPIDLPIEEEPLEETGGLGVWYQLLGTGNSFMLKTTSNIYSAHSIAVYEGSCDSEVVFYSESDAPDFPGGPALLDESPTAIREILFPTSEGTDYYVQIKNEEFPGSFELEIEEIPAPENDLCINAEVVACGDELFGDTRAASPDGVLAPACGSNIEIGSGVWYKFVGTGERIELSTCSDNSFDTSLGVYRGECESGLVCLTGNEDGPDCPNYSSSLFFNSVLGEEYLILVDGYNDEVGEFSLSLNCTAPLPAPANDHCTSAEYLTVFEEGSGTPTAGTNVGAADYSGSLSCDEYSSATDVWYSFNSGYNTSAVLTAAFGTADYLFYALYEQCGEEAIQCESGFEEGEPFESVPSHITEVVFEVAPEKDYLIQVWNSQGEGDFTLILNDGPNTAPQIIGGDPTEMSRFTIDEGIVTDLDFTDDESHDQLFSITSGNEEGVFTIDELTGEVTVANAAILQASVTSNFTLGIRLSDQGPGDLFDQTSIPIWVIDNEPPVVNDVIIYANEEVEFQDFEFSYTVEAIDAENDDLIFEITSGNPFGRFSIDDFGEISVNYIVTGEYYYFLDFEVQSQYILEVKVTEDNELGQSTIATITINVNDLNDAPIYQLKTGLVDINAVNDTPVGFLDVEDVDEGQVLSSTITSGNEEGVFALDAATGQVTVVNASTLLANGEREYELSFVTFDDGEPVQSTEDVFKILAQGTPMVTSFSIAEDAEADDLIGVVSYSGNANLVYRHYDDDYLDDGINGIPFYIELDGTIRVGDPSELDFEEQTTHYISIVGEFEDEQPIYGLEISIHVTDANEEPVFEESAISSPIVKNFTQDGDFILQAEALDPDGDVLTFSIDPEYDNGLFDVDAMTGIVTVRDISLFDFNTSNSEYVYLIVSDGELDDNISYHVTLVINAPPVLTQTSLELDENVLVDSQVSTLESDDIHGIQSYEILSGNEDGFFALDEMSGVLTLVSSLDYETIQSVALEIQLTDNGPGELSSTKTIQITINDVNEFDPSLDYTVFAVEENATLGTEVVTLMAFDQDTFQEVSLSIVSGNTDDAFVMNGGSIEVSGVLNHELLDMYVLTVEATDNGAPMRSSQTDILIEVGDLNEEPVHDGIADASIEEGEELIFTVSILDEDDGAVHTHTLNDEAIAEGMSIDELGVFSWTPEEVHGGTSYEVTVTSSDGEFDTMETFEINVEETNDIHVVSLSDLTATEGVTLTFTVEASDEDIPGSQFNYDLDVNSIALDMTIDAMTGEFSWLPTENDGGTLVDVSVTVSDDEHEVVESFTIDVSEVNEAPVLVEIEALAGDEGVAITFIASATDADLPANTLTYDLDVASANKGMIIDQSTGAFTWTPGEEQQGEHEVIVTVSDGEFMDEEVVVITVNELNTSPALATIETQTGDELTEITFTLSATDTDFPANTLIYGLDANSADEGMNLDASTGVFTWTPAENQDGSYEVTLTVSDGELTDEEILSISVNEVNMAPELSSIGDKEGAAETELTFSVTATDVDLPANTLTYSLDDASIAKGMNLTTGGNFSWLPENENEGNHTVIITVSDGDLDDSDSISITIDGTTKPLAVNASATALRLYPNPSTGIFKVSGSDELKEIVIYDFSGKISKRFLKSSINYDISELPSGMYTLLIKLDGRIETQRLMKN